MRDWQESSLTASRCLWVTEQASWADLIPSAVQFLSDGIVGEFFVLFSYFVRKLISNIIGHPKGNSH